MTGLRVLFMGTPEFSLPALEGLLAGPDPVVAVVTQPDRPAGRKRRLTPPPVKVVAEAHGVRVLQPARLLDEGVYETLAATQPDVAVVVAFGKILRPHYLELPRLGCLNIHASLLPRWRGAAPINWAVVAGDAETGVTLQQMDAGLDTGPVLATWRTPIGSLETAGELHDRLAPAGAALLSEVLAALRAGRKVPAVAQDEAQATYARMLSKEDGHLQFDEPAQQVAALIRGLTPWPGAVCETPRGPLKLVRARALGTAEHRPGEVVAGAADGLFVAAKTGLVEILECQRPGRQVTSGTAYVNGLHEPCVGEIWTRVGGGIE